MTETTNDTDADSTDLLNTDYVSPDDCLPTHHDDDAKYTIRSCQNDRFGNVLAGLLHDGDKWAFALRRDDCYNQDGSLPSWSIKAAGDLNVVDVEYDTDEEHYVELFKDSKEMENWTVDIFHEYDSTQIEDIDANNQRIVFYNPDSGIGRFTVQYDLD